MNSSKISLSNHSWMPSLVLVADIDGWKTSLPSFSRNPRRQARLFRANRDEITRSQETYTSSYVRARARAYIVGVENCASRSSKSILSLSVLQHADVQVVGKKNARDRAPGERLTREETPLS